MSFIDNLSKTYEKVWEGSGITSTRKSDIEKYGCEIVKRILKKFPEMSYVYKETKETTKEIASRKGNEKINNLIDKIKEKDNRGDKGISDRKNLSVPTPTIDTELTGQYDFRKTTWGMNQAEVIQSEENVSKFLKEYRKESELIFQGDAGGIPCYIFYEFAGGKLTQTVYWFYYLDKTHANKNDYISEYSNLKERLTRKYGSSFIDKQTWNNNLYKNDSKNWGVAVSLGHLDIITGWETSATEIGLVLNGEDNGVNLYILYTSRELKDLMEKTNESNKSLDDF